MLNVFKIIVFVSVTAFSILSSASDERWTTEIDKTGRYLAIKRSSVAMNGPYIQTYCNPGDLLVAGGCSAVDSNAVITTSAPYRANGWECGFLRVENSQIEDHTQTFKLVSNARVYTKIQVSLVCQSAAKK